MTAPQIFFIILAVITLGGALMVVTARNLVHSAFWLILVLFSVALIFGLLQAGFLAIVQVVIYIGAISILLIFTVMLTRQVANDSTARFNANWIWAALLTLVLFAGLAYLLVSWPAISTPLPEMAGRTDQIQQLGTALVSPNAYALPFEVASVLLLAALIGAVVVAWEGKSRRQG